MGYDYQLVDAMFDIPVPRIEAARRALVQHYPFGKSEAMALRVAETQRRAALNIADVMKEYDYAIPKNAHEDTVYQPEDGPIVTLWCEGERPHMLEMMMAILIPYLEPGSYIEYQGEDGEHWRHYHAGDRIVAINPDLVYATVPHGTQPPPPPEDELADLASTMRMIFGT